MKLGVLILIISVLFISLFYGVGSSDPGARDAKIESAKRYDLNPCPVCGKKADERVSSVREARLFYFCSAECALKFKENSLKYLSKMADAL